MILEPACHGLYNRIHVYTQHSVCPLLQVTPEASIVIRAVVYRLSCKTYQWCATNYAIIALVYVPTSTFTPRTLDNTIVPVPIYHITFPFSFLEPLYSLVARCVIKSTD